MAALDFPANPTNGQQYTGDNGVIYTYQDGVWWAQANLGDPSAIAHNDLNSRDAVDGHPIAAITNLQTTLDGKAPTTHNHTLSQITDSGGMAAVDDAPNDGEEYVRRNASWQVASAAGSVSWGAIGGTLSNQSDLYSTNSYALTKMARKDSDENIGGNWSFRGRNVYESSDYGFRVYTNVYLYRRSNANFVIRNTSAGYLMGIGSNGGVFQNTSNNDTVGMGSNGVTQTVGSGRNSFVTEPALSAALHELAENTAEMNQLATQMSSDPAAGIAQLIHDIADKIHATDFNTE